MQRVLPPPHEGQPEPVGEPIDLSARFRCPISFMIFCEVVMGVDGHYYERDYIKLYIQQSRGKSMFTREQYQPFTLIDPVEKKNDLDDFLRERQGENLNDELYLSVGLWQKIFAAIEIDDVSRFSDLVKHRSRFLEISPDEAMNKISLTIQSTELDRIKHFTAYEYALRCGSKKICKFILEKYKTLSLLNKTRISIKLPTISIDNLFFNALSSSDFHFAKNILLNCEDINAHNIEGDTLLHIATKADNQLAINLLLTMGAKLLPDQRINSGLTPVHIAAIADKVELLKLFNKYTADSLKVLTPAKESILHSAVKAGAINAFKYLYYIAKLDPHFPDINGLRPLHVAAASLLIDSGSERKNEIHLNILKLFLSISSIEDIQSMMRSVQLFEEITRREELVSTTAKTYLKIAKAPIKEPRHHAMFKPASDKEMEIQAVQNKACLIM